MSYDDLPEPDPEAEKQWQATCAYMEQIVAEVYPLVVSKIREGMAAVGEDPDNGELFRLRRQQVAYSLNAAIGRRVLR